jgi:flagellar protein FlgJ
MTPAQGVGAIGRPAAADDRARVRKLAQDLEGVFLDQLFKAMRQSVPQDGAIGSAPGQEMFTEMFDERMATEAARHMSRGLGDALYRQLAAKLPASGTTETR